jgi:hypothetical protein
MLYVILQVKGWTQGWRPSSVKKKVITKSKEVKTWSNLAESSKEGYIAQLFCQQWKWQT